jgi:hydantoinase/carbamoylase family amidase
LEVVKSFMIEPQRLIGRLEQLGEIGADPSGGVTRLALTPDDARARDLVQAWMEEAGMNVQLDAAGNIIGRYPGREDLPPVLLASHIDTVPNGGIYDGTLGVLSAIEVCHCFREEGYLPRYPVEVVSFTMEESSRFGLSMLGSKAATGKLKPGTLDGWRDQLGTSLAEALRDFGLDPDELAQKTAEQWDRPFTAGLELHIEQGQRLISEEVPLGVVTGIAAPTRLKFTIVGEAMHSGASVLEDRKDALVAGAEMILEVVKLTKREKPWETIATVGQLRVAPDVINVVPGEAELGVDVRGVAMESKRRLVRAIEQTAAKVAARRGMTVRMEITSDEQSVELSEDVIERLAQLCEEQGWPYSRVLSMAGHDIMQLDGRMPLGLIFVRNVSGTSHSPAEDIAEEDIKYGLNLLYQAVRDIGERGL